MTIRPIIFSEAMVRALLEGRKTQTRRLATSPLRKCEPGEMLYVREAFIAGLGVGGYAPGVDPDNDPDGETINVIYRATYDGSAGPWKPSIHMPRWASRLTLRVTGVRFQGIAHIDEDDAKAEGAKPSFLSPWGEVKSQPYYRWGFYHLWNSLHDKPGERWEDNPEVVALTFEVIHGNVDLITPASK